MSNFQTTAEYEASDALQAKNDDQIPAIVVLDLRASAHPAATSIPEGRVLPSYAEFRATQVDAECFVILADHPADAESTLRDIRHDPQHYLKPVVLDGEYGVVVEAIADGMLNTDGSVPTRVGLINQLADTLPTLAGVPDKEDRLLRFLYTRPDYVIQPVRNWTQPRIYRYPLLDVLAGDEADCAVWLGSLSRRNLIERVSLVDRLRDCPKCGYSHLSYIDVCPNCFSIEIEEKPFLHCHACGNVAPQQEYLSAEGLTCRRCNSHLRHIGVDYDHSLENFSCSSCNHSFIDPRIEAHCNHCGQKSATEALLVRNVETWQLSDVGRLSVRNGNLGDIYSVLDDLNYASPGYFKHMLEWQSSLSHRHEAVHFSLLCIKLENIVELVGTIGRNRVMLMLDGLAVRLRNLIRTSDIATRTSELHFWLLLPQTPRDGCQILLDRIKELQTLTRQDDGTELHISAAFFSAPEQVGRNESADIVMNRLEGQLA